jgi:hypothetical protein
LLVFIKSVAVGAVAVAAIVAFLTATLYALPIYGHGIHFDLRGVMVVYPWTTRLVTLVIFAVAFRWQFHGGRH